MSVKRIIAAVLAAAVALAGIASASAAPNRAVIPLVGEVARGFDPPVQPWLSGHRGVDIAGVAGQTVVAAMDGVVTFAGVVVDRPVITLKHGDRSTTYEPVDPSVSVGQVVAMGAPIGTLVDGHPCPAPACLHWGLRDGGTYLNPLSLLGGPVRLIAAADLGRVRADSSVMLTPRRVSAAGLTTPVVGTISSPYGMRVSPIDGAWRFHDGLDIAASCGSPIRAAAAGVVTEVSVSPVWGNRLVIDHGVVAGHALVTAYNHAAGYAVEVGTVVSQGQTIGQVGTTGQSTGCHLHFQTWLDGESTDPAGLLP